MKISEYIKNLQQVIDAHGDIEVEMSNFCGDRVEAPIPKIDYRKILKGRESKPGFWQSWSSDESQKGENVCRIA